MTVDTSRFGIGTPGLAGLGAWEEPTTFKDTAAIVSAADRMGYHHVCCAEHIGVPAAEGERRGLRYFDPLATFGYFSAITSQIRFTTAVLVLGYHHPLEIAKRYGTLDVVSGGRLVLGLGVGTLKEEFDLLGLGGAEFTDRGVRADDALRALRASLGQRLPEYHGPHYDFGGLVIDPCALQQHVPFWIGGNSPRSLRRALELGDGWMPFGLTTEEMAQMLAKARDTATWRERERPLEFILSSGRIDPLDQPEQTAETLRSVFSAGATKASLGIRARSASHYIEQLECVATMDI